MQIKAGGSSRSPLSKAYSRVDGEEASMRSVPGDTFLPRLCCLMQLKYTWPCFTSMLYFQTFCWALQQAQQFISSIHCLLIAPSPLTCLQNSSRPQGNVVLS